MPKALHLPYRRGDATQVGRKLFRKQILPIGSIEHDGETLNFTQEYLKDLAQSFNGGAFDQVAFQFADSENRHTQDPERFRGEVKGLEVGSDGLYGVIELTDQGTEIVSKNPKLGVSARIIRGFKDGKDALQHVLATLDPKVTGMKPWEQVELSEQGDAEVTDLTGAQYSESVAGLTDEEKTQLQGLAKRAAKTGDTEPSDEEVEKALAQILAEAEETEEKPEPVAALSKEQRETIELAKSTAESAQREAAALRNTIATERFERQRDELLKAGVPPAMIDLAEPVLKGSEGVIELSNGTKVDARNAMSKMLEECKGMIDLSVIGVGDGEPNSQEAEAKKAAEEWAKASS